MKFTRIFIVVFILISTEGLYSQDEFLYSSDGKAILRQRELIQNCLKNLGRPKTDETALTICRCQVGLINRYFTSKQFKNHTRNGIIDINSLVGEDSVISKSINNCYRESGQTALLAAQSDATNFISNCVASIQKSTKKSLDATKLRSFCTCELDLIKSRKFTDEQLKSMEDPNSLLFYEMLYTCGNPFSEPEDELRNWSPGAANAVRGPDVDTVNILNRME